METETDLDLRDRSCLLRCSLRLNARLQYWHLYFFSGADAAFFGVLLVVVAPGSMALAASAWAIAGCQLSAKSPQTRK
jgi:hypothetical protein